MGSGVETRRSALKNAIAKNIVSLRSMGISWSERAKQYGITKEKAQALHQIGQRLTGDKP